MHCTPKRPVSQSCAVAKSEEYSSTPQIPSSLRFLISTPPAKLVNGQLIIFWINRLKNLENENTKWFMSLYPLHFRGRKSLTLVLVNVLAVLCRIAMFSVCKFWYKRRGALLISAYLFVMCFHCNFAFFFFIPGGGRVDSRAKLAVWWPRIPVEELHAGIFHPPLPLEQQNTHTHTHTQTRPRNDWLQQKLPMFGFHTHIPYSMPSLIVQWPTRIVHFRCCTWLWNWFIYLLMVSNNIILSWMWKLTLLQKT